MHRIRGLDLQRREASALFGDRAGPGPCPGRAGASPPSSCTDRLPAATSTRGAISSGISASGLTDLPIEPLCYTEEEFAELVRSANPFIARHWLKASGCRRGTRRSGSPRIIP
jgi:hypothetical protein